MGIKGQGHIIKRVAAIHGYSTWAVRKILNGERKNAEILATLNKFRAGEDKLHEALQKRVKNKTK